MEKGRVPKRERGRYKKEGGVSLSTPILAVLTAVAIATGAKLKETNQKNSEGLMLGDKNESRELVRAAD